MRILNVSSALGLKSGGGTAERTFQMSRSLGRSGLSCTVLTIRIGLEQERIRAMAPASVTALDCLWKRFYVPRPSWKTVRRLVNDADVVHLIGHWGVLNVLAYAAARMAAKPYVVCPAGALPLFGRSSTLKRLYNLTVGNAIIRDAAAWIAVTPSELAHFENYGIPASSVTVIPNGVVEEDFPPVDRAEFLKKHGISDAPIILFVGRLNLIKGPDLLLASFLQISEQFPRHHLVFVGPDGGMLAELSESARHPALAGRVHFLGHLDGAEKAGAYQAAQLLVVPSRQEAMSIVALEAGVNGVPVMLTDQCGFDEMASLDPRLVVPASSDGLATGLVTLLGKPEELQQLGLQTKAFVHAKYTWATIVEQYVSLYRKILSNRCIP